MQSEAAGYALCATKALHNGVCPTGVPNPFAAQLGVENFDAGQSVCLHF